MSAVVFKDTSVSLSTRDDCFLTDIPRLVLEISSNGRVGAKIDLFSRESSPGVWDTKSVLVVPGEYPDFMVSIWMELGGNERQLLAFMELNASVLLSGEGMIYEIPLLSHENYPSLILKTRPSGMDNIQNLLSGMGREGASSLRDNSFQKVTEDGANAFDDFERLGNLERLEYAVTQFEKAVSMVTDDDPRAHSALNGLGVCLLRRFERLKSTEDINNSIAYVEKAVNLTPDGDPNKPTGMSNLGNIYTTRFQHLGIPEDLDNAIIWAQKAVDRTADGDPFKPGFLSNLGRSFSAKYKQSKNMADLDNAIASARAAIKLSPSRDPQRPIYLTVLGSYLSDRRSQFPTG
ncbi:hypothetical protein CPB86DRAFT_818759 [Serendipita vermifera]|nr:hypothetical protein CPB86DRAFT_818759 [Serendipita vermifera]